MKETNNKVLVICAIITALSAIIVALINSKSVMNIRIELENDAKSYQDQIFELRSQSQLLSDRYTALENDYKFLKESSVAILSESETLRDEMKILKNQVSNKYYSPNETTEDFTSEQNNLTINMLDIAPAYQSDMYAEYTVINNIEGFNIAGINYPRGFTFNCEIHGGLVTHWNEASWALYNLKGEFSRFKAMLGLVDGTLNMNATLEIYFDGILHKKMLLKYDMLPDPLELNVTGVSQLKILVLYSEQDLNSTTLGFASGESVTKYGFGNPVLVKSVLE